MQTSLLLLLPWSLDLLPAKVAKAGEEEEVEKVEEVAAEVGENDFLYPSKPTLGLSSAIT
jgi:hypothetical protein